MKKMLLMFFAAAMLLSLLSCGGEQSAYTAERPEAVPSPEEERVEPVQDVKSLKPEATEALPSLPAPTVREAPNTPVSEPLPARSRAAPTGRPPMSTTGSPSLKPSTMRP